MNIFVIHSTHDYDIDSSPIAVGKTEESVKKALYNYLLEEERKVILSCEKDIEEGILSERIKK